MRNKLAILYCIVVFLPLVAAAQNNTFSPYSRYGLGEIAPTTLAHTQGMGGAYIALKPDSVMPIFINTGNPAAYALLKVTSLEVGGSFFYSKFTGTNSSLRKWSTNFAYGTLGFPIRSNGGACFGIMPYSNVGYDSENSVQYDNIGTVTNRYRGSGGFNKAFIGYGVMPFHRRLTRFQRRYLHPPDSMRHLTRTQYATRSFFSKLLTDFSIGANINYIFGNTQTETNVAYPNSILYRNTYTANAITLSSVTGNFGAQTAVTADSVIDRKKRRDRIDYVMRQFGDMGLAEADLAYKRDSVERNTGKYRRALEQKVKFVFGYFMALNNTLNAGINSLVYNYSLDGSGSVVSQDTLINLNNQPAKIVLPLEQGFGIGFKKGERLNLVADFAITSWQKFSYLGQPNTYKANYRIAAGANFVPDKYAAGNGAYLKKVNYRFGAQYQTGYIVIRNTTVSDMSVSAGVGFPVGIGRLSSMVNVSGQYGIMGTTANGLLRQNYWRVNFGFTFSDRWFQKFRYD